MEEIVTNLLKGAPSALMLLAAVLWFARRDTQRDEERARVDLAAAKRESDCAARMRELEDRHSEYMEQQAQAQTKALAENTNSNNNLAAVNERMAQAFRDLLLKVKT